MSTEPAELGEGHSPAAWTAVVILLVAFAIGTICFWFSIVWAVWASAAAIWPRLRPMTTAVQFKIRIVHS